MDSLIGSVDSQTVLVVAAIAVSLLLITLLYRILKAGLGLILTILAIVLVLQSVFGISPGQLWGEIGNLPQDAIQVVKNLDLNSLMSSFSS
jgi:glucan phosphoethanolaminetransferase (alkaline phosphatase superfamily)